jgi:hypothetical protein
MQSSLCQANFSLIGLYSPSSISGLVSSIAVQTNLALELPLFMQSREMVIPGQSPFRAVWGFALALPRLQDGRVPRGLQDGNG